MENKISIDVIVYENLLLKAKRYDLLLQATFDSADLDLFNELRFDLDEVQKAIKVLDPFSYQFKQAELIHKKKLEEEEASSNE